MATKYFRITGYVPSEDFSFILDSNGMFEKLWQFSSYCIEKGIKIIEVSTDEQFKDINIPKVEEDSSHVILRATQNGKPQYIKQKIDDTEYNAINVENKIYIP